MDERARDLRLSHGNDELQWYSIRYIRGANGLIPRVNKESHVMLGIPCDAWNSYRFRMHWSKEEEDNRGRGGEEEKKRRV